MTFAYTPGLALRFVDGSGNVISEKLYIQVKAVTPPGLELPPRVEIYRGTVTGGTLFIGMDNELFRRIVEGWVAVDRDRSGDYAGRLEVGLTVYVWRYRDGNVERYAQYVTYNPKQIFDGGRVEITVTLASPLTSSKVEPLQEPIYYWETVWYAGPENATYLEHIVRNGEIYTKVPVLIIDNVLSYSGTMEGWIDIAAERTTEVRVAVGVGYQVESKAINGDPSGGLSGQITLYGTSWSSYVYFSKTTDHVPPNTAKYIYIVARPITEFSREYVCPNGVDCYPTGWEKMESYVQDISVNGVIIEGGVEDGLPPQEVMDWIFDSDVTYSRKIQISGTPTEDGDLDPGEALPIMVITSWVDTCNADFEISLGLGVLLAKGVAVKFPHMGSVVAGISASASQQATYYVMGGIENLGHTSSGGYDVFEILYLRMSNFQYRQFVGIQTCYYNVPVAMYIKSW